jgi:hypothetical protein
MYLALQLLHFPCKRVFLSSNVALTVAASLMLEKVAMESFVKNAIILLSLTILGHDLNLNIIHTYSLLCMSTYMCIANIVLNKGRLQFSQKYESVKHFDNI